MKEEIRERRICPLCNQEYTERPAVSKIDGVTPICPDCGTRQALESICVSVEEQDKILQAIHKSMKSAKIG